MPITVSLYLLKKNVTFFYFNLGTALAVEHSKSCARLSKDQVCHPTQVKADKSVRSTNVTHPGGQVLYTCLGVGKVYENTMDALDNSSKCSNFDSNPLAHASLSSLTGGACVAASNCSPTCKNGGTCASNGTFSYYPVCQCPSGFLGTDCSIVSASITCQDKLVGYWPLVSNQIEDRSNETSNIYAVDIWNRKDAYLRHGGVQPHFRYVSPFYPNGSALLEYFAITVTNNIRVDDPEWPQGSDLNGSFFLGAFVRLNFDADPDILHPLVSFHNDSETNFAIFLNRRGKLLLWYRDVNSSGVEVEFWAPNVLGAATPLTFLIIDYNSTSNQLVCGIIEHDTGNYIEGTAVSLPVEPHGDVFTNKMLIGESDLTPLPSNGVVILQGSVACLSLHRHTLPLNQTYDLIDACWPILGGPEPPEALQSCYHLCKHKPEIPNANLVVEYHHEPLGGIERFPDHYTHLSTFIYVCNWTYTYNGTDEVQQNVTCIDGNWHIPYNECTRMLKIGLRLKQFFKLFIFFLILAYEVLFDEFDLSYLEDFDDYTLTQNMDTIMDAIKNAGNIVPNMPSYANITTSTVSFDEIGKLLHLIKKKIKNNL